MTKKISSQNFNGSIPNNASSPDMESLLRQMSNENTSRTFSFNAQEAQKARDFSEYMSNTSHQREVEDLKRAGLNPVLSANGGAQAYSASSASGTADNSAVGVLASIYQTKMNNDNAIKLAKLQNQNNLQIAKINAAAQTYASNNSYSASKYATDRSKYGLLDTFVNGLFSGFDGTSSGSSKNSGSKVGSIVGKIGKSFWNSYNRK